MKDNLKNIIVTVIFSTFLFSQIKESTVLRSNSIRGADARGAMRVLPKRALKVCLLIAESSTICGQLEICLKFSHKEKEPNRNPLSPISIRRVGIMNNGKAKAQAEIPLALLLYWERKLIAYITNSISIILQKSRTASL